MYQYPTQMCVCLLGFNVAFKHLSIAVLACSHIGMPSRRPKHDTPPGHSIQTQGRPVIVLSTDVEHYTGIHNYLFQCLGSDPLGNPSLIFHTHQLTHNSMMLLCW